MAGNAKHFRCGRVVIEQTTTPYSPSDVEIPDGCEVRLKAPSSNMGLILISDTRAGSVNPELSFLLEPGDPPLALKIESTGDIYISGTSVKDELRWITEQKAA